MFGDHDDDVAGFGGQAATAKRKEAHRNESARGHLLH